ncbi:CGNR zinc finger domain-containing protein [Angustibacter aerolatus]
MTTAGDSRTARYGLGFAPDGLYLAQELLNSGLPGDVDADPLTSLAPARAWLTAATTEWAARAGRPAPDLSLSERDLPRARRLRDTVRAWLDGGDPAWESSPVAVGLVADRRTAYGPASGGAAGLESLVAVELLLADRADRLRRLKVCANPECGAAFYDGSPNASRRWHDVRTCGNVANLRASRARRAAPA